MTKNDDDFELGRQGGRGLPSGACVEGWRVGR